MIQLFLVRSPVDCTNEEYKRFKEVCLSHGGAHVSPSRGRDRRQLPSGYIFSTAEAAEAAEAELAEKEA